MAQGESFYVDEEEAQIAKEEPLLAPPQPGVRVSQAPSGVVGVPAAPGGEVRAVEAGCLDERARNLPSKYLNSKLYWQTI